MKIRKILLLLVVIAVSCTAFVACSTGNTADKVTVTISETQLTMIVDDEATLTATASDGQTVAWSTTNPAVASVENGKITALSEGQTTVKASIPSGEYAECKVTVNEKEAEPVLNLNKDILNIKEGNTFTLTATVTKGTKTVSDLTYNYVSSAPEVATVSATGVVEGVSVGETTVTVSVTVDGKTLTETCEVTVVNGYEITVSKEAVDLSMIEVSASDIKTFDIGAKAYKGDNETPATFIYTSSAPEVATVDATGKITAVGIGESTVTVKTTIDGRDFEKSIEVAVVRTTQTEFEVVKENYATVMINKPVTGYYNSQVLQLNVEPYAEGIEVVWEFTTNSTNVASLTVGEDNRQCTITIKEICNGGDISVHAIVEGKSTTEQVFTFTTYYAVSQESDLWALNNRAYNGTNIYTKCLLTNDIVCQNNDPDNSKIVNGQSVYLKGVVGRSTNYNIPGKKFSGLFDGNGYTISNLKFTLNQAYCGLFSWVDNGTIKNLGVELAEYVYAPGTFDHGAINYQGGAIVGYAWGLTMTDCYAKVVVASDAANTNAGNASGGLVGFFGFWASTIENCFVEITAVKAYNARPAENLYNVGAFVGTADNGNVNNCYAIVTQNDLAGKVDWAGKVNANGKTSGCILATGGADLLTKGFTADKLNGKAWNVNIEGTNVTVSLVKGCTVAPIE